MSLREWLFPTSGATAPDRGPDVAGPPKLSRRLFLRLMTLFAGSSALAAAPGFVRNAAAHGPVVSEADQNAVTGIELQGDSEDENRQHALQEILKDAEAYSTYTHLKYLNKIVQHYQLRYFGKDGWSNDKGFFEACFTTTSDNLLDAGVKGEFLSKTLATKFRSWAREILNVQQNKGDDTARREGKVAQAIDASLKENGGLITPVTMLKLLNFFLKYTVASAPPNILMTGAELEPVDVILKNPTMNQGEETNFDSFWDVLRMKHWQVQNADGQTIDINLYRQTADDKLPPLSPGTVIITPGTSPSWQKIYHIAAVRTIKNITDDYSKAWYVITESQMATNKTISDYKVEDGGDPLTADGMLKTQIVNDYELKRLLFLDSQTRHAAFVFNANKPLVPPRKHEKPGSPQPV